MNGSRKREHDYNNEYSESEHEEIIDLEGADDQELNVDQFLSQNDGLNDFRKRAKIEKKIRHSQQSQRLVADVEQSSVVAGVIKSVHLENFMCHENFELEFGPRLNFIIGHNGSGKSAILTAISVCLGAKATETNRGSKLKDLIKEGKDYSIIKVVLVNEGIDVYEPEKFGRTITIERRIRRDTISSPYLLKSENGKIVSNKKQDLDALLDYFTITVNNPMVFLSQDMARSFLTASTDDMKYKYFMKGTMMEEIIENLKKTNEQLDNVNMKLLRMKDETIELKTEYSEAEALHQKLRDSNDLRTRQAHLYGKYFWLEVDDNNKTIASVRESQQEYIETIALIEDKIQEINETIENYHVKVTQLRGKDAAINEQQAEAKDAVNEMDRQLKSAVEKAESTARTLSDTKRTISQMVNDMHKKKDDIAKEEEKVRLSNGGSKELLMNQLEVTKQKEISLNQEIDEVKRQLAEIDNTLRDKHSELNREKDEKREEYISVDKQLKSLSAKASNPLAGFPDSVGRLLNEIKKNQFDKTPIGPLGAEIKIKEEFKDWSQALNAILGSHANNFIVQTFRDQRHLQSLAKKVGFYNCTVVVRRAETFDYSHGLPDSRFQTVLNALSFRTEETKYALIDLLHIESVALIPEKHEARTVITNGVRNITSVTTFANESSCNQLSVNSNGGFTDNVLFYDLKNFPKIIPEIGSQVFINTLKQNLISINREMDDISKRKEGLNREFSVQKSELNKKIKELSFKIRQLRNNMYEIETKLRDESVTGRLEILQEELVSMENQYTIYEGSIDDIEEKLVESKAVVNEAKENYKRARHQLEGIKKLRYEYQNAVDDAESNIGINETKKVHYTASKEKRERELASLIDNLPTWEAKVQENTEQAQKHCTREQADAIRLRDLDSVRREIERVSKEVDQANQLLGKSPQEIVNEAAVARNKFRDAYEQFTNASESRKMLHESIHNRMVSFRESRIMTCVSADVDFKDSLGFRNFNGNLDFDFERKKLKMLVSTKNDKKPRHVDSLSGGEKSFSQIALLLATWKPMNSRIKGLDEFDVFMDQVNRKIGMRLMLSKLSANPKNQTIFITPQDIGQIAELDERFVKIHRVRDPRAAQQ